MQSRLILLSNLTTRSESGDALKPIKVVGASMQKHCNCNLATSEEARPEAA